MTPWKILLPLLLAVTLYGGYRWQSYQITLLRSQLETAEQALITEKATVQTLATEVTAQHQQIIHQHRHIETVTAANNAAAQRLRETEARHVSALRTLEALRRQNQELATWAAAGLPAAADDWLRNLITGTDHHHPHSGADTPAAAAGADPPTQHPQPAGPPVEQ